ncbi:wall-associated receptor kinase-like protein [Medicago truncatula]|uniref:Wall-associated receptor kinase-like protein n=2 Tax=Medicago truncatula TaxID=3880 RepID=A0A072VFY0_MEDTR|nr:wall-associated receptor kinase-like protein [Medicago truncatula]
MVTLSASNESFSSSLPGCKNTCGNVEIPYPFGISNSSIPTQGRCYLESKFELICENNRNLFWDGVPVTNINFLQGQLSVLNYVSSYCTNKENISSYLPSLDTAGTFSISRKENKFLTVGCDSYGILNSIYDKETYSIGCLTICNGNRKRIENGTCSGIGCCEVDIPPKMRNITIEAFAFFNSNESLRCRYSFVVKNGAYNFSVSHLDKFPHTELPLILDWSVASENCKASKGKDGYACMKNSVCDDEDIDFGYRCKCKDGFEGNPYLPDGCKDINECKTGNNTCIYKDHCHNIDGSYKCFCPKGQSGNGTREGGCHTQDVVIKVVIGSSAGIVILFVGISSLYLIYQKRKLIKLKQKFFQQNGGFILLQKLFTREDTSQSAQIFTEKELKKATNSYDESLIIGRGGFGTIFKGVLPDNRIVAVKKSRIIDANQIEQFINEVVILSQINHRNVVKLLGCCLETEVPSLVYEFVSHGTLFDFIQNTKNKINNPRWETRLRIAAETAGALSYLHSSASFPIIHRDVKSTNILLDDNYTAKVSDFGASKLVPLDQTEIATVVQGTLGYLDPEYMQTHQLTEKSDVYSFGVVLAELLTGDKPLDFNRPEETISLAMHFLSCLKQDKLFEAIQVGILNDDNKEEIKEVAILAARCLRLRGEERPSMKEIAMELDGIRLKEMHPWNDTELNFGESQRLLHEASSSFYDETDSYNLGYSGV